MDYEIVSEDDEDIEDFEEVELYEPVVNIILIKTKLFAVLCCH
jgi:hypothetical protein